MLSRPIYNRHHVFGGFGIGSSIGGSALSVQRLLNCCLRYPSRAGSVITLELMTHPGAPETSPSLWGCGIGADSFSQSSDRVHEHAILTNPHLKQYLQDQSITLVSYVGSSIGRAMDLLNDHSNESDKQSHSSNDHAIESNIHSINQPHSSTNQSPTLPPRIVILLSLKEGTGNTITGTRIAQHAKSLGFVVQMVDTTDHFASVNLAAILSNPDYNRDSSLAFLFCIHALRAGVFAAETSLPFVMMLGGTDINVNALDDSKRDRVKQVLHRAAVIIAFTHSMKQKTLDLLGDAAPPVFVVSQVRNRSRCDVEFDDAEERFTRVERDLAMSRG